MPVPVPTQKLKDLAPRLTLCLAIDLMGSTTAGLKLSSRKLDRFNIALVDQLNPYLELVQLNEAIVKFTGDGWMVMSDEQEDAAKLCCLAIIMSHRFQWDIMTATGLDRRQIPAMRLAICWGRDLPVLLPNGSRDFVGSSARRAVRASALCRDNEILVDETVRAWISHDFSISTCNIDERRCEFPHAKMEEELVLHVLDGLKDDAAEDPEAPVYFVDTFSVIGQPEEAQVLATHISDQLLRAATSSQRSDSDLTAAYEELLTSNLSHEMARKVMRDLKKAGLRPNHEIYHGLLEHADSFLSLQGWIEEMKADGVAPDLATLHICLRRAEGSEEAGWFAHHLLSSDVKPDAETLSLLVEKAANYALAASWCQRFSTLGVLPDLRTHELLVEKAQTFDQARTWLESMMAHGWSPSEQAYLDVFSKGVLGVSGDDLLSWYLALPHHPAHPIKRAIAEYRRAGRVDDALRLSLDYPHTDTALKTFRQFPDRAVSYFREVLRRDPDHPNGAYALGMALLGVGQAAEAAPWMRKAYELAAPGQRKDELARHLAFYETVLAEA
ncbi:MAG TPA: hypothetical protein VG944_24660 [Fimbriimonas sp.]|nr:hypothetical protein [Fimbriimonas sp.]